MIKYIGSKRNLLSAIVGVVQSLRPDGTVIDLFSGTSRVGHALKRAGYQVLSNDVNTFAAILARCYVQTDRSDVLSVVSSAVTSLNRLAGDPGYFTQTFCEDSRYIQPKNGARIDAMRNWISAKKYDSEVEAVLLVALMEAADRVDSTTGLQMAYLKGWSARSHNDIELRVPDLLEQAISGKGKAFQLEAQEAANSLSGHIAYLDPPYNQHSYLGNYHIWETLVRWDAPEAYGIARKRVDVRSRQSDFNSKRRIKDALRQVVADLDVRDLVVSFNNEGYITREEMIELLATRGDVIVLERGYKRYVGAQIGIFNPSGKRVGEVSHLQNKEYLFVVSKDSTRLLSQFCSQLRSQFVLSHT